MYVYFLISRLSQTKHPLHVQRLQDCLMCELYCDGVTWHIFYGQQF